MQPNDEPPNKEYRNTHEYIRMEMPKMHLKNITITIIMMIILTTTAVAPDIQPTNLQQTTNINNFVKTWTTNTPNYINPKQTILNPTVNLTPKRIGEPPHACKNGVIDLPQGKNYRIICIQKQNNQWITMIIHKQLYHAITGVSIKALEEGRIT